MKAVNEIVNEGFQIWGRIAGAWEGEEVSFHSWDLRSMTEELNESRELDLTGVTSFMLLRALTHVFLNNEEFTAYELVYKISAERRARLDLYEEMIAFLDQPEVEEIIQEFTDRVRTAVRAYGVDHDDLEAWLESPIDMAFLRRDALRAMKKLGRHQFCWGKPASKKAGYNTKIFEFWNVPSLLRAMQRQQMPGISVCLIRCPDGVHSYFAVAIANGESLSLLTDKPCSPNPEYKNRTRRPERDLLKRAYANHFPYEVLDLEIDAVQREAFVKARVGRLVPYNQEAHPIKNFDDLHPENAIWLTLLFDRIEVEFFNQNLQLPEPSYTTEMVRDPHALVEAGHALVKAGTYKPLVAQELDHNAVSSQTTHDIWDCPRVGNNEWMILRYGALVPQDVFNVVGLNELGQLPHAAEVAAALPAPGAGWFELQSAAKAQPPEELPKVDRAMWLLHKQHRRSVLTSNEPSYGRVGSPFSQLDPLDFGPKEKIQHDRTWVGRHNFCAVVRRLAGIDYARDHKKIEAWYWEKIREAKDQIVRLAATGELKLPEHCPSCGKLPPNPDCIVRACREDEDPRAFGFGDRPHRREQRRNRDIIRVFHGRHPGLYGIAWGKDPWYGERNSLNICAVSGAQALYHTSIDPFDPYAIAHILGLEFDDLPWQLQNWYNGVRVYGGNSILNSCDPADRLKNPWHGLNLTVLVRLSRSTVHKLRKELGLPRLNFKELQEEQDSRA